MKKHISVILSLVLVLLAVIQLPENVFRTLLDSQSTPTLLTDEFPQQERWLLTPAPAEDLMPVYYLLEG